VKDADPETLGLAIRAVARREALLPRRLVGRLIAEGDERERQRRRFAEFALTRREEEVLDLLREGKTTAEIAARLFVSQVTVRTHISSIFRKLHVHDREAAVRLLADAHAR
jgi:DNA-binding NarL/FixJ family response regulator